MSIFETTSHVKKTVTEAHDLTLRGQYLGLSLIRLHLNIKLEHWDTGERRGFTLLQIGFINLWEHIIPISGTDMKMIDSQGFQHKRSAEGSWAFNRVILPGSTRVAEARFDPPPGELEGQAKAVGWIWFDALPDGVKPSRIIHRQPIFAPGTTSGWVQHYETLEFIIPACSVIPSQLALPA